MVNNEKKTKTCKLWSTKKPFFDAKQKESQHYGSLFKSWHNAVLLSKLKWEGIEHDKLFQLQRWLGATCHKQMHKWLAGDPSRRVPRMEHLYLQLCRHQPSRGWRSRARKRCCTPSSGAPAEPLPCYLAMQKTQTQSGRMFQYGCCSRNVQKRNDVFGGKNAHREVNLRNSAPPPWFHLPCHASFEKAVSQSVQWGGLSRINKASQWTSFTTSTTFSR